jgi:argininosuccinate synthase
LGTSIIIPWLKENYGCEVVALVANVGQDEEVSQLEEKALRSGASKVFIHDLRKEFVSGYLWSLVKSGAAYEGSYLLGSSIARPLIAKRQAEIAIQEGADALAHGCPARGNDQVRFERAYQAFVPQLKVIAPWREWEIRSRHEAIAFAKSHRIPISVLNEDIYSHDSNLWHMSYEGGILDDLTEAPPKDFFERTLNPSACPDGDSEITIDFENGVPVGLNGQSIPPVQIIEDLNEIGGTNGIGRVDLVEDCSEGVKSRGIYETPGGTLIMAAHRELESLVLDRQTRTQKDTLSTNYAQLVYDGHWFTSLREALDAFFAKTNEMVTGSVTLSLYKGNIVVRSRRSPNSLYHASAAYSNDSRPGNGRSETSDGKETMKHTGLASAVRVEP